MKPSQESGDNAKPRVASPDRDNQFQFVTYITLVLVLDGNSVLLEVTRIILGIAYASAIDYNGVRPDIPRDVQPA